MEWREIMKKLKVDLEDIAMGMDHQDRYDQNYYLDTETAETVCIPGELMRALEEGKSLADLPPGNSSWLIWQKRSLQEVLVMWRSLCAAVVKLMI